MTHPECPREQEVFDAIRAGQWPELAPAELREHATSCTGCGDLALVAHAMFVDFNEAVRTARVRTAGAVWWRAQRRARQEAVKTATRTVTAIQMMSVVAAVAVAIAIIGVLPDWNALGDRVVAAVPLILVQSALPLLFLVAVTMAAPVALYLAFSRD